MVGEHHAEAALTAPGDFSSLRTSDFGWLISSTRAPVSVAMAYSRTPRRWWDKRHPI